MQPPPKGWKGLLSLVTWELSSCLSHLSSSIASARPPWQRIRHGTKQTKQERVSGFVGPASSAQPLTWAKPPTADTPKLREVCGSRLSAHAGWLAICADWILCEVGRFAWWRISGARSPGAQASTAHICVWRTDDACAQRSERRTMSHDTWVALHVLGVVVFLGNLVVTAVWKTLADRTRDASVIAYAQRLVTITDVSFTATGAALITLSGFALADDWGGVTGPSWLTVGVGLFAAAGLIWLTILIPIQIAQTRLSRRFAATGAIPDRYWRLAQRWYVFGAVATLLPLANVFVMALKP